MKKITKKIIKVSLALILLLEAGVGGYCLYNNYNTPKVLNSLNRVEKSSNSKVLVEEKNNAAFAFDKETTSLENLESFRNLFSESLKESSSSYLIYSEGDVPTIEAYSLEYGYIKGQREATCGKNSEYSSWVYTINNKYFSRILLSGEKLNNFNYLPTNSKIYYKANTYVSENESMMIPNFALVDGEIKNDYVKFVLKGLNTQIDVPQVDNNFTYFEGNFKNLSKDTTLLYGVSSEGLNKVSLITDFTNFYHIASSKTDMYLLKGDIAEDWTSNLMSVIFNKEPQACNDFSELVKSPYEVCETLNSFYCPTEAKSMFFNFDDLTDLTSSDKKEYYNLPGMVEVLKCTSEGIITK